VVVVVSRSRLAGAMLGTAVVCVAAAAAAPASRTASDGGTYRVGWEAVVSHDAFGSFTSFGWTDGFDPTAELTSFGVYTSLLVRTLVGTDHVAGKAGTTIVPDLAVRVPRPTNGGRTYSFTLRHGVRFGPPVNREITSRDLQYAIERLARERNNETWYSRYFHVIKGFDAYNKLGARSITGIATPDSRTIRFTLTHPTGDFLYRLALPLAGPIPRAVARCFEGIHGAYGFNLVSSGPYMIEGSDEVDPRSCDTIEPIRGISDTQLTLVRNPSYDPRTDTRAARESRPDRFVFVAMTLGDLERRIAAGELDDSVLVPSRELIRTAVAAARRTGTLRVEPADAVAYLALNLTQPPFDDVHVRRALNWVLDKAALRRALGGRTAGAIAQHVFPDRLLNGMLAGFHPYRTRGDRGDLTRARAEMAASRYGSPAGICTAKVCKRVLLGVDNRVIDPSWLPIVRASAARIGIELRVLRPSATVPDPGVDTPIDALGWAKDYADLASFAEPLFGSAYTDQTNASLVGLTPAQARLIGVNGRVKGVPGVDAELARCSRLTGRARIRCYAALDRELTTRVVPWVPILSANQITILGPQVARWTSDANYGSTGFGHVALRH